ncbi:MAG: hypothetical protein A2928_03685 [Candidatus Taylorbacteria bacterium RIFCSPLOWO2_01_FULL_45_15b]|uniref:RNHCP domain-containing protein n=1 Tax=Candidatus Taylorbacteria bacterium RIFCSPLOWO2_01_FULL_45_15b TaxID=1802319 RepID=A0A1G2NF40_9BACT|nr:MAG: hypothetical protein A2928_03685 [Candidatus Taylorbacteria bacterium RIFCSPLOWO2_01_FULL_45_15b]
MEKRFTRNIEDFVCGHCGKVVRGNGYTNHCSICLWSKHVDVNPGDRADTCGGLMSPVRYEKKHGEMKVIHVCEICAFERPNVLGPHDTIVPLL